MKSALVAALSLALAAPVLSVPSVADAQVLTGRGSSPRRAPPPRPALSDAEIDRLFEAQDLVADLDAQIAEIRGQASAGGLTADQNRQIAALGARRAEAQRTIDRLEAKRDR